jgi:acetyl esterase/lipase
MPEDGRGSRAGERGSPAGEPGARSMKRHAIGIAALVLSAVLLLFSMLAIFPAPTYGLWKLRILVTECGHFIAPLCLLTPIVWRRSMSSRIASIIAVLAGCLFFTPLIRAAHLLRSLPEPRPSTLGFIASAYAGADKAVDARAMSLHARNGEELHFAFYPSAVTRAASDTLLPPLVLVIHGGSWQSGEATQLAPLNYHLARRGFAVAALTYRFAPRDTFPAQLDDIVDQIGYLRLHARDLGFDANHIVVLGRSAGAQLALLYAYTTSEPSIKGVISYYGPADLTWGYAHPARPHVHDSRKFLREYLGGTQPEHPSRYEMASPITYARTSPRATLLLHGTSDDLVSVWQSRRLAAALLEARQPATFVEMPWATHGCDYIVRGPCYRITTLAVDRFLSEVIRQ